MAQATPNDSRNNLAMVQAIIEGEPTIISGQIGIHALAKLADMMPHKDFVAFLNDALHAATNGAEGEPAQPQQASPDQSAPAQPQPSASPASEA